MTIFDWLNRAMLQLRDAGVDSPRRDALVFIEDTLGNDRAWVLANHDYVINDNEHKKLETMLKRRIKREPLAYIRGKAWFYGRFFEVNPYVMIPRPESESFINMIKELKPERVIDVGTGSGCLAVSSKLELPQSEVIAADISKDAILIAEKNGKDHDAEIKFAQANLLNSDFLLQKLSDRTKSATILANLPYVPEGLITSPEIRKEPVQALFSGKDGLGHYRNFWQQVDKLSSKPKYILAESMISQHSSLKKLVEENGYSLKKTESLVQLFEKTD